VTKDYHALGRLLAFRRNGALRCVGTDHLGGTIRVADASFTALGQMRYTPFGVARDAAASLGTDHRFTSQVEDASIGLYWYASRAYDPALGRFTCPDSIVPTLGNPQSLNRYSYVRNNPLGYTDPSGHRERRRQDYAAGAAGELQYHRDRMHDLAEQGLIESGPGGSRQEGMAREAARAASREADDGPRRPDYANGAAGELQYQRDILTRMAEQGVIASGPGGASLEAAARARALAARAARAAPDGPTYTAMQQAPQRPLPPSESTPTSNPLMEGGAKPLVEWGPIRVGYIDVNFSWGFGLGYTGGFLITSNGLHPYGGGGIVFGASTAITASPYDPTPGWNAGVQGTALVSGQLGVSLEGGGPFIEIGVGVPPGGAATVYYVPTPDQYIVIIPASR
jgi:RHS repeat-associated protein